MSGDNNEGWEKWSNHVLLTLEKLEKKVDTVEKRINDNNLKTQVEIVSIKASTAVWGIIAGFVVSALVSVVVGVLVYHLTVGLNPKPTNDHQPSSTIDTSYIIPRDEKLDYFFIEDKETDV